jgi:hypothetical protein
MGGGGGGWGGHYRPYRAFVGNAIKVLLVVAIWGRGYGGFDGNANLWAPYGLLLWTVYYYHLCRNRARNLPSLRSTF